MITTTSELKTQLVRFIGENWFTVKDKAEMVIEDMMGMASGKSVKELIGYFKEQYPLEIPENYAVIWQGVFGMKALSAWENPEKELQNYLDEFIRISDSVEEGGKSPVCHAEDLSFEEQAALFAGIELGENGMTSDFYRRVCRCYPNLEEIPMIYMVSCLDRERYHEACRAVKKFEEKYSDDFELLKRRLTIYSHVGSREEVHRAAADMLDYQKKYNTYSGWVTLNFAANVQVEHGDMEGALQSYQHLVNDWSRLSLKEEEGCMYVATAFVNMLNLPSRLLEENISLITVQFCLFEQAMERAGVNFDAEPYSNIVTTYVVEMSKKLGNPAYRTAFSLLLDTLEERTVLKSRWYQESFESGHNALESYRLNEDEQIARDTRFLCLSLYSDGQAGEFMPYSEKYELYRDVTDNAALKSYLKEQYPYLYPKLQKMIHEVAKKGKPAAAWDEPKMKPVVKTDKKVGRNDPCPCGSGKKYKKCCGR